MVTTEYTHHGAACESAGERFLSLAGGVAASAAAFWRAWQNRRSVAKLLDWDDRMLGDIGLSAGDVRSVMALPASEDPSARLDALSLERRAARRATAREQLAAAADLKARTPRRRFTVIET